jgi:hypothetical protein
VRSAEEHEIAVVIIDLMRGVVYRESQVGSWAALERYAGANRTWTSLGPPSPIWVGAPKAC